MGGILLTIAMICLGAPALRLLLTARRERREAELWLGLGLALATVGLPLRFLSGIAVARTGDQGLAVDPSMAHLSAISHGLTALACVFLYVFVWRVFHPGSARVRLAVSVVIAGIVLSYGWLLASGGHTLERHPSVMVGNVLRAFVLPWCCFESIRYWRMMKRRVALGIADPVVANRFALWALWTGTFTLLPAIVIATKVVGARTGDSGGVFEAMLPIMRGVLLLSVLVAFVCIGLSFFPPERYRARLRARSAFQPTSD